MRYAIIGDIHANLEALEAVIDAISQEKVDQILCIGDIVGYGADPIECIRIVKEKCSKVVAGNHDYAAIGLTDIDYFNPFAKDALLWTSEKLGEQEINYLASIKLVERENSFTLLDKNIDTNNKSVKNNETLQKMPSIKNIDSSMTGFTIVHATLNNPREWGYILNTFDAAINFEIQTDSLCFVGHSHVPVVYMKKENFVSGHRFVSKIDPVCQYIVNVGSVGQPRDGDCRAAFVIYDMQMGTLKLKRVEYDIKKTQQKIINANLPQILADRLIIGR